MTKITNENSIEETLKYIGLELGEIPNIFKQYESLQFRPIKTYDEQIYKVYKYVPISKIQILLTPTNRLNTIQEKYSKATPLAEYLDAENQENIEKHTTFLRMLRQVKIQEIEQIDLQQKELSKQIPFKVKFDGNYLWQIYYSDISDTYFMLVPTEDLEYSTFFYLLKKQIEYQKNKKEQKIFVPICYSNYSNTYLKSSEISDIEKYLWFFTKNWCNVYETYDKKEKLTLVIVGDIVVYENMTSFYRIKLDTKEEAVKFYKLIKALFILQTQLPHYYNFIAKINRYGALQFEYQKKKINYEDLVELLNKQYIIAEKSIIEINSKEIEYEKELNNLKQIAKNQDEEYLMKEKQIATYLECRKTFFGRIKYFLKSKKNKKKEDTKEQITEKQEEEKVEKQEEFLQKDYYTIEDIVQIYKELDEKSSKVKNFELDINALKNKIKSMEIKINNANQYIEEIDKHEKNIFEFWKFTNKDENLLLNEGEKQVENTTKKIEKVYDYKEDIEEVGNIIDKAVRQNFNKNELDYIYLLTTNIFEVIKKFEDEELLQQSLENLKQEIDTTERLFSTEKDIFGNLSEDATKIKVLGNKKHREIAKDKIKILEIDNNTTIEEYKNKIASINENIKKYIDEAKSIISIPIYIAIPNKEKLEGLQTFSINPEEAINNCKAEGEIYLHKINIKQGNPLIFFSNSVYFENNNKTLPYGMNMGTRGVINVNNYKIKNTTKDEFRINHLVADKYSTKKILLNEYEIIQNEEEN